MDIYLQKGYQELYKLYDSLNDDKEKKLIQQAVELKSINDTDLEFQPYPEYSDINFP